MMTIGELSRRSGVHIKKLREYTDHGLVYSVGRSPAGYRLFDEEALWCTRWIGELRGLGLTVAEIRSLARTYNDASPERPIGPHVAERLRAAQRRLHARMTEIRETLRRIDEFEAAHWTELADGDPWEAEDPRRCRACS